MNSSNTSKKIIVLFTLLFAVGLFFVLINRPFLIGHDIYFHLDAAEEIIIRDLQLPKFIPNYWGNFLFGYPPLYHWLTAVVSSTTNIPLMYIFSLSIVILIPVSIYLVFTLFKISKLTNPTFATALYSLSIVDILWPLYSGEYPRFLSFSLALLSFIFLLSNTKLTSKKITSLLLAGLLGGFAAASNMIGAIFVFGLLGYFGIRELFLQKTALPLVPILLAVVVSSFWWLRAIFLYGYDYFYQVLTIHDKATFSTWTGLGLLLLLFFFSIKNKSWPSFFAIWLVISIASAGTPFVMVPIANYLHNVFVPRIQHLKNPKHIATSPLLLIFSFICMLYIIGSNNLIYKTYVTQDVVEASKWVQDNTIIDDSVLAFGTIDVTTSTMINQITAEITGMYRDEVIPYFSNRNTFTWFGYEWSVERDRYPIYRNIHQNICVDDLVEKSQRYSINPAIIWINKDSREFSDNDYLCDSLDTLETIYENETILLKRFDLEV